MARKYGGLQGKKVVPNSLSAPGAWIAPTEQAREKSAASWPSAVAAGSPAAPVGSLSFAMTRLLSFRSLVRLLTRVMELRLLVYPICLMGIFMQKVLMVQGFTL